MHALKVNEARYSFQASERLSSESGEMSYQSHQREKSMARAWGPRYDEHEVGDTDLVKAQSLIACAKKDVKMESSRRVAQR